MAHELLLNSFLAVSLMPSSPTVDFKAILLSVLWAHHLGKKNAQQPNRTAHVELSKVYRLQTVLERGQKLYRPPLSTFV